MTTQNRELASLIDNSGNVTATGNLTVSGTTTTISSTVQTIADPLIELNTGASSNSNDLGFVFERGSTGDNACLIWDESADVFVVGTTTATGTSTGNMSFTAAGLTAGAGVFSSLDISGDIDVDGTTNLDVVDIDGAVDMASTLGVSGVVTANAGVVVDNITIDGTEIDLSSGDLTLDVAGDIILDADGGDIKFADAGTTVLEIKHESSSVDLSLNTSNDDFKIKGSDDGSSITALTLDMSEAGQATFNGGIVSTAAANTLGATSFNEADLTNVGTIYADQYLGDADAATGIVLPGSNVMTLHTNNSERIRIDASGNVGIGTNSPGGKVHVSGNAIGDLTTANDGAFNLQSSNDFKCTPSGNITMTFSNFAVQSGNVLLVNSGGHTISAHSDTLVTADLLSTVSTAGTYLLSYFSDGTDAYVTNSTIYS